MSAAPAFVEVGLSRGSELSAAAIGYFGGGWWSHAFNLVPLGRVIEPGQDARVQSVLDARFDVVGGRPSGVHVRPISYLEDCERLIIRIPTTAANAEDWLQGGVCQLGKPYDPVGILRLALGEFSAAVRDWRDDRQWFCSELDGYMLERGRIVHKFALAKGLLTPGDIALVGSAIGRVRAHLLPGQPYRVAMAA